MMYRKKSEGREVWTYVNLRKSLINEVDRVIKTAMFHGEPKYRTRQEFVVKAVQTMLHKELTQNQVLEVTV